MLTVDDVKARLGEAVSGYSDELISDALAAETAAQRSVCDLPAKRTEELDDALVRRVEVTLAGSDGKRIDRRLGGADEEVRRLEAGHSKRRASERDEQTSARGRRRRRSTPKE